MAQKFRFRDFPVYKDAIAYRIKIKNLVKKYFPLEEKYLLTDQIIRAANSVVLQIAEGTDRGTDRDFALFLNRSHTSLCEIVACLDIALKDKHITEAVHDKYLKEAEDLANQITAFRRSLLKSPKK